MKTNRISNRTKNTIFENNFVNIEKNNYRDKRD